jgi:tryptophan 2,3-dioxygenase
VEITYGQYLKVQELLSLQQPVGEPVEHDETLFIIIHQVYELWFKQQIHEGQHLRELLAQGRMEEATSTLARMLKILKTMVAQIDVLDGEILKGGGACNSDNVALTMPRFPFPW